MKFHYYLENSSGWAGISIEIENFKKNYSISYGWDDCDIKDLLGGIISLIGDESKLSSGLEDKYLINDNSFEWTIIGGPEKVKFKFLLLDENSIEINIFESSFDLNEEGSKVFTGIVNFKELISNILFSCNNIINKYGILGYYYNFWVEFPLFFYLYLKNIIEKKLECEIFIETVNCKEENMFKTNIENEFNLIKSFE